MDSYIHFDNSTAIYSGGQIISGKFELKLNKTKKIRCITIKLKGRAKVEWSESHRKGKSSSSQIFYAKEKYFKERIIVLEGGDVGEVVELRAGKHVYPFKYLLPSNLPPSFEGQNGNIRYSIKVIIERPWKLDQKNKTPFVIETPPDFLENYRTREPVSVIMEKTFGVIFKSQPLIGILKAPHSGFKCGHPINLTLEINNWSNVAVKGIKFELNKILKYKAKRPHYKEKVREKTIWKSHLDCHIDAKTSKTVVKEVLVPHFDIFNLTNCSIIDIDHEIQVEVQTAGLHLNMFGSFPIFPMYSIPQPSNNINPINNRSRHISMITNPPNIASQSSTSTTSLTTNFPPLSSAFSLPDISNRTINVLSQSNRNIV